MIPRKHFRVHSMNIDDEFYFLWLGPMTPQLTHEIRVSYSGVSMLHLRVRPISIKRRNNKIIRVEDPNVSPP